MPSNGGSAVLRFFYGFLLFPVALVHILVTPGQPSATRGEKKCPYCAEIVKAEAVLCKHCGSRLDAETPASAAKTLEKRPAQPVTPMDIVQVSLLVVVLSRVAQGLEAASGAAFGGLSRFCKVAGRCEGSMRSIGVTRRGGGGNASFGHSRWVVQHCRFILPIATPGWTLRCF